MAAPWCTNHLVAMEHIQWYVVDAFKAILVGQRYVLFTRLETKQQQKMPNPFTTLSPVSLE